MVVPALHRNVALQRLVNNKWNKTTRNSENEETVSLFLLFCIILTSKIYKATSINFAEHVWVQGK